MARTVFDKLVAGLSSRERRDMLERIASSVKVVENEVVVEDEPVVDLQETYERMGVLRRFVVMLAAFFTGRDRLAVVEAQLLRDLGRRASQRLPHGLDLVQQQLRPGAGEDFRKLSERARRFSAVLGRVMGRERRAFVAFLAGLHAPEAQTRLVRETDPFVIGAEQPELRENEVKRRAVNQIDEIASTLAPALRQRIYTDVRAMHQLMALSAFPFDRLVTLFRPVPGGDEVPVPLARIVDDLSRLAGIYDGMGQDPSALLFEGLGLYQEQDRLDEEDGAVEDVVREHVDDFSRAYADIKEFGRRYPLTDLVRIAHATIHYRPTPSGGGEDWFAQWKGFWRERVDEAHHRFAYDRHVDAILAKARSALDLSSVEPFPGYPPSGLGAPARHGLSMGVLHSVFDEAYDQKLEVPIGTIFRDGEFYKADNRTEMDRAWQALQRVRTDVANLEVRLRPSGDLGLAWRQATDESLPPDAAAERRQSLVATIDGDARALLHRAVETFRLTGELLQGVLYGTVGGRYDTVSNLGELGGRTADTFVKRLEQAHVVCKVAAETLTDLQNIESTASHA